MPLCPNCQADNLEGVRFCERCGHRLRRRPNWVVPAISAVAVLIVAGAAVAFAALRGDGPEQEPSASRSSPGSTPSPSPSPTATGPVELEASFPEFVIGSRVNFWVNPGPSKDDKCVVNLFRFEGIGKARGAFRSECSDWAGSGRDIYLFSVTVINRSDERVPVALKRFVLVDRKGGRHRPMDLRDEALFPENFLRPKQTVRTDTEVDGYVVFDADPDFVPRELSYRDGTETLTIVFEGKVVRNPPR